MKVVATANPDVMILEPRVFADPRGLFLETWNEQTFARLGIAARFVQDNHSLSCRGVVRGLHYQVQQTQGRLVRVTAGAAFDVAVDLRRSSPHFGTAVAVRLDARERRMVWIPPGFAHGFLALEDGTELLYKCTDFYAPAHERALRWNDPALGIDWPLGGIGTPLLSPKDEAAVPLAEAETFP